MGAGVGPRVGGLLLFKVLTDVFFSYSRSPSDPISPRPPARANVGLALLPAVRGLARTTAEKMIAKFGPKSKVNVFCGSAYVGDGFACGNAT